MTSAVIRRAGTSEYDLGDVNCDGSVGPVDVVFYVNYVYLGNDMFCPDPCEE